MKIILTSLILCIILINSSFAQVREDRYYTLHNTEPNVTLKSQSKQLCFFEIEDLNEQEEIYFYIYGSEFDLDNDSKYTDLAVFINDKIYWRPSTFVNNNFGKDGKISHISFIITKFVKEGMNSIVVANLSDSSKTDYAFIKRFEVITKRKEPIILFYLKKSIIPILIISIAFIVIRIIVQLTKK